MNVSGVMGNVSVQAWQALAVVIGGGLVLGAIGPFDTFSDLTQAQRYGYWVGLLILTWLQIVAAARLISSVRWAEGKPWPLLASTAAMLGSIPAAFEVAWAESLLRVERDLGVADVAALYGDVLLIAVPLTLVLGLLEQRHPAKINLPSPAAGGSARDGNGSCSFLSSIPADRRGRLLALSAEDHYLRVHTDRGNALVHSRFADALEEVDHLPGVRVHRSWWVATEAVERAEKEGDRQVLILANGLRVPVSRTHLMSAREAGLLR